MKLSDVPAPNLTFDREIRMYLGGREIQVFHLKRGHTDGDSIIYFPKAKWFTWATCSSTKSFR